ncbi:MAG: GNAT family N-acetyltransferase [Alistipes sp.]|nr:GNAT family N-acetyltransferase [Alistipes sp.]
MEIASLEGVGFDTLAEAFARTFADYDTQWDKEELRRMLRRRGFDPALSFGAFDKGRLVAFTFNGIGWHGGRATAYDTGTGTCAEWRGRGLAGRIFEHAAPRLKAAGVRRYLLEVLQHNAPAVAVYRKAGFETARSFAYFRAAREQVARRLEVGSWPTQGGARTRRSAAAECTLRRVAPEELAAATEFRDFEPSWQNSFAAVERAATDLMLTGAYDGPRLVGYCIAEPASGDIAQIAVAHDRRREGIGSHLLAHAVAAATSSTIKIINTQIGCASIEGFLASLGIEEQGRQFEMTKEL